jgi:hypothetical protein
LHNFRSHDWFAYLSTKLPLNEAAFPAIMMLETGDALVVTSKQRVVTADGEEGGEVLQNIYGYNVLPMHIRERLTADRGATRKNHAISTTKI